MTHDTKLMEALQAPFAPDEIEWRVQSCGQSAQGKPWCMVLAYVTNRAIQNRLDQACGIFGWKNEFRIDPDGGIMCAISIMDPGKEEWVTKWDGADSTQIEAIKGGRSGAMKRAGAQWGIGRYLYKLEECFAVCQWEKPPTKHGWERASFEDKKTKQKMVMYWQTPTLPDWAVPGAK